MIVITLTSIQFHNLINLNPHALSLSREEITTLLSDSGMSNSTYTTSLKQIDQLHQVRDPSCNIQLQKMQLDVGMSPPAIFWYCNSEGSASALDALIKKV